MKKEIQLEKSFQKLKSERERERNTRTKEKISEEERKDNEVSLFWVVLIQ